MLNVKTAVSLDVLADELINDLKKEWKSPFEAPVVIFAENKIEQWFKLKWLEKYPALANLNTKRIDNFLLDILAEGNKNIKILGGEILRNIILSYLTQKNGEGKYNYECLNAGVKNYLEDDGILNELRLFDFASEITNLFKEYEITRPSDFKGSENGKKTLKGFIETWRNENENSFFRKIDNKSCENEEWQYKLYCEIFDETGSIAERVNGRMVSYQKDPLTFYTLPQLYENNRSAISNEIKLKYNSKLPVFVFGLSGIGQFYRVALQKLAENTEINIFIQSPVEDILNVKKENINNELLNLWGKTGIDNITLWKSKNIKNIASDFSPRKNTLLNNIKNSIAENKEHINAQIEEDFPSITVTTAPSKIREIENLHSQICRLLNGSVVNGKQARFSDILVVSPNIEDYKTAILEVFAQAQTKADEERDSDEKTVVSLPFKFVDASSVESLTAQALETLFQIRENGSLSRPEFFSLVRNPVVQLVRDIKNEEIIEWERWITDMNIYRDRKNHDNKQLGWLEAVKRLLLARFSTESIFDGNDEYLPYANIASSDNDSLCRFIDCVEELENWINKDKWLEDHKIENISGDALDAIMEFISGWLFMKEPPKELISEAIVFNHIKAARENLKFYFASGSSDISWRMAHLALVAAAKNADYNSGSVFLNGVTFMKFAPNRSLPAKYLFMLGASADALPGRNRQNSLDLRDACLPWEGDVLIADKNRFAFLSQLMNTSEGFYISYVNKDLQKDEDFYPSSIITDIRNFLKQSKSDNYLTETEITLDETRSWEKLFTKREIRNKATQQSFDGNAKDFNADLKNEEPIKIPTMVGFYSIKSFLQDPFEFQANRVLGIDDIEEDPEKTEFEPITAEFFYKLKIERMSVALKLGIQPENKIKTTEDLLKKAIERGWLPDSIFWQKEWTEACQNVDIFADAIETKFPKQNFTYYKKKITADIINNEFQMSWKLIGEFLIVAENDSEIHFINIFKSHINKKKNYLSGYVAALALLCSDIEIDKNIFIDAFWLEENKKNKTIKIANGTVDITTDATQAENLLNAIYKKAYYQQYKKVVPVDLFNSKDLNYSTYIDKFEPGPYNYSNPWNYFPAAKVFDVIDVCGFEENKFNEEWEKEVQYQKDLMPDLWRVIADAEEEK